MPRHKCAESSSPFAAASGSVSHPLCSCPQAASPRQCPAFGRGCKAEPSTQQVRWGDRAGKEGQRRAPSTGSSDSSPRGEEREGDCEHKCCGISDSWTSLPSSALEKPSPDNSPGLISHPAELLPSTLAGFCQSLLIGTLNAAEEKLLSDPRCVLCFPLQEHAGIWRRFPMRLCCLCPTQPAGSGQCWAAGLALSTRCHLWDIPPFARAPAGLSLPSGRAQLPHSISVLPVSPMEKTPLCPLHSISLPGQQERNPKLPSNHPSAVVGKSNKRNNTNALNLCACGGRWEQQ